MTKPSVSNPMGLPERSLWFARTRLAVERFLGRVVRGFRKQNVKAMEGKLSQELQRSVFGDSDRSRKLGYSIHSDSHKWATMRPDEYAAYKKERTEKLRLQREKDRAELLEQLEKKRKRDESAHSH